MGELENAHKEEFKIMWEHANWVWRFILIFGIITFMYLMFLVGSYIGKLIG